MTNMNEMNSIACIEVIDFAMIRRRVLMMMRRSFMIKKKIIRYFSVDSSESLR
jgi:hypothetical protein